MNLTTQTKNSRTNLDLGVATSSLLDQLDRRLNRAAMARAAARAVTYFEWAADQPASEQAALVTKMSSATLRGADCDNSDSLVVAVGASALLIVAKLGPATASERIRSAMALLSARYQVDR